MLCVPSHSEENEASTPGWISAPRVSAPLVGGLLGAKPLADFQAMSTSLLGWGLHTATDPYCGFFSLKGVRTFCFGSPLGRHPWHSLCDICSGFPLLLGSDLPLLCITSDLAAKAMDFMPMTELKRQIQYFCSYTFFSGVRKVGISIFIVSYFNYSYFLHFKLLSLIFIYNKNKIYSVLHIYRERKQVSSFDGNWLVSTIDILRNLWEQLLLIALKKYLAG